VAQLHNSREARLQPVAVLIGTKPKTHRFTWDPSTELGHDGVAVVVKEHFGLVSGPAADWLQDPSRERG
jgi:hypothetical protein